MRVLSLHISQLTVTLISSVRCTLVLWTLLTLAFWLPVCSCGSFFVGFISNPGGTVSVRGTVIAVATSALQNIGFNGTVTTVTLSNSNSDTTLIFCGDQQLLFLVNQTVQVEFTTGVFCSTVVRVTSENESTASFRHQVS